MSYLESINACNSGAKWADSQSSYREAWDKCERGDWMLWIAKKQGVDLRVLTRAKVECAKVVEHLIKDERSINALRVAERFADGDATREELSTVYAYADVAVAYAYAVAAAAADVGSAYADARVDKLKICADICRKYIKFDDLEIKEGAK
jgi:hypothetical protein